MKPIDETPLTVEQVFTALVTGVKLNAIAHAEALILASGGTV